MPEQPSNMVRVTPPTWMMGVASVVGLMLVIYLLALTRNAWRQHTFIGRSSETPHTITISGTGSETAVPDIAVISLGLQTEKKTVSEAQAENTETMNKARARLDQLSIPKEDISTSQYSVYPQQEWNPTTGRSIIRGYVVTQQLTVKVRNFDKIPQVLQMVGDLNLNQVGGLTFTIDEPETYRQNARLEALTQAKTKAQALAQAAGVGLGRVVSFSEGDAYGGPIPYYAKDMVADGRGGGGAAPSIDPGSQEIMVNVTVTYELE